jgi:hypothetical protein
MPKTSQITPNSNGAIWGTAMQAMEWSTGASVGRNESLYGYSATVGRMSQEIDFLP